MRMSDEPFSEFAAITIPLPDTTTQTAIARYLNVLRQEIDLLDQSVSALQTQKRGLMQKLLTGQWRLSPHPITHIFPRPSQHLAKSLISKDLFRSQATCQDSS
jgi:type I restriction enzyme S subunit